MRPEATQHQTFLLEFRLVSAESVLVIGGGPTGVEIAAEIANEFPRKRITLVHPGSTLLPNNADGASRYAESFLRSKNVEIMFGNRVLGASPTDASVFITDRQRTIKADLAYMCCGGVRQFPERESLNYLLSYGRY